MSDNVTFYDDIEGYCNRLSYTVGDAVELCVSTKAETYSIRIERDGASPELVWEGRGVVGAYCPAPEGADAQGCDWPVSVSIPVDPSWRSGFYLITLVAEGVPTELATAHAGFVVRSAKLSSKPLLVLATNTWNAYNIWGGASLYTGGHTVSFRRPFGRGMLSRPLVDRDDRKARPTRWDEEADEDGMTFQTYRTEKGYPAAIGSSGWFTFERRFVCWAEENGYDFDYAISSDMEEFDDLLDGRDLVVGVGHDEYWSAGQRAGLERHVEGGGNVASFSGNTMFWQVRLESTPGDETDPYGQMVCYKYAAHTDDPVMSDGREHLMSGMWADPVVARPEAAILGGGSAHGLYHRFGHAVARGAGAFTVYRDDHWMVAGTGLRYGDMLGARDGVVGYETLGCRIQFDEFQLPVRAGGDGSPQDLEIIGFVPSSNLAVGEYPKSISALSDQGDLEFVASRLYGDLSASSRAMVRHGNAVMLTCWPFGRDAGEVVAIGTTDWTFGLENDKAVGQVTANVLNHLGSDQSDVAQPKR